MDGDGTSSTSWSAHFHSYIINTYDGVDYSIPGNGGPECTVFLTTRQKLGETFVFTLLACLEMYLAWSRIKLPTRIPVAERGFDRTGKKFLLVAHTLTFGIELGYKLATKQTIFLLNPCHVVTMMQIYLLAAPPTRFTMALFRVMMHSLNGASIALIFPVVNTRLLPFETETYYIQHGLMLVVPYYLMRIGGVYTAEPGSDWSWAIFTTSLISFYHWIILTGLGTLTQTNLNNMLCPAISDPFYGQWYRCWAALHQTALILIHGKVYTAIARNFLPKKALLADEACTGESNGHAKLH